MINVNSIKKAFLRIAKWTRTLRRLIIQKIHEFSYKVTARHLTIQENTIWTLDPSIAFQAFKEMSKAVIENDTWMYFAGVVYYGCRLKTIKNLYDIIDDKHRLATGLNQAWFPFVYPPNLASLDFILRVFKQPEQAMVLDYNCGMGAFGIYAKALGFPVWLFDNAIQVSSDGLNQFWDAFGLSERLVFDWEILKDIPIRILNCAGIWLTKEIIANLGEHGSIEFVLVDTLFHSNAPDIPGFTVYGYYPDLLWVYKKNYIPDPGLI